MKREQPNGHSLPPVFQSLLSRGCLSHCDLLFTSDGFCAAGKSLSALLASREITTFPNAQDQLRDFDKFYDDWYLYTVSDGEETICSLFKMREQEFNARRGEIADGDTPGVTVCFIAFDADLLLQCIDDPTLSNRKALHLELSRVVADRGQRHHRALKAYFLDTGAQAPYLIAKCYVTFLASLAQNSCVPVPEAYWSAYRASSRLPRFIEANNKAAGCCVCDHRNIYIRDANTLSIYEQKALLATHTADVSFHAFAAEVRCHARFLVWYARLPIPFLGRSVYDSAIRADLSIGQSALEELAPFHWENSRCVRQQRKRHHDQP